MHGHWAAIHIIFASVFRNSQQHKPMDAPNFSAACSSILPKIRRKKIKIKIVLPKDSQGLELYSIEAIAYIYNLYSHFRWRASQHPHNVLILVIMLNFFFKKKNLI